jgi:hypothetical protein
LPQETQQFNFVNTRKVDNAFIAMATLMSAYILAATLALDVGTVVSSTMGRCMRWLRDCRYLPKQGANE